MIEVLQIAAGLWLGCVMIGVSIHVVEAVSQWIDKRRRMRR